VIEQGALPYAGTSGWSGSQTSFERAIADDSSGVTNKRQREALEELMWASRIGLTWKELGMSLNLHHGQASGVLSVLHKAGEIERLKQRRNKCAIYVLPQFVHDRETEKHGNTKAGSDAVKLKVLADEIENLMLKDYISIEVYLKLKATLDA
jgi:hypothetical protein